MFHNQFKPYKKTRNYIVTTIKVHIRNGNRFVLSNKETIIYKKKELKQEFLYFLDSFPKYKKQRKDKEQKEQIKELILDQP